MSSLQKEVYRSILSLCLSFISMIRRLNAILGHNVELLQGLIQPTGANPNSRKVNIKNMLMQLRK